jgi:ABC-2 type transport system permease protein
VLDKEVPQDINILVIADMKNGLTDAEKANLDKYSARGGNLLIAGETRRQQVMNGVVAPFGVQFVPGMLVNPSRNSLPDFILSKPTKAGGDLVYLYDAMRKGKTVVTMPGAVGLEYTTDKGYDAVPLFVSDSTSWNEMETTNFIDDTVKLNPAAGEVQKSYVTGLALSRRVGKKMQKIVVLGDADCISNGEISISRQGVKATNYSVITGAFFWMSDNEVPIDVRRPNGTDDNIALDKNGMATTRVVLIWGFTGLLALCAIVIWVRRRGR